MSHSRPSHSCTVTIRTRYYVNDRERLTIAVLGSVAQLGRWDPARAARAETSNNYDWEVTVELPLYSQIEWKWAVVQKATTAIETWETRNNRELFFTNQTSTVLFAPWNGPISILETRFAEEPGSANIDSREEIDKETEDESVNEKKDDTDISENIDTETNTGDILRGEHEESKGTPVEQSEQIHEEHGGVKEKTEMQDHERENVGDDEAEEEVKEGFCHNIPSGIQKWRSRLYKVGLVGGLAIAVIGGIYVLKRRFF